MSDDLPLIGVSSCLKPGKSGAFHSVGDKYVDGIADGAGGLPVLIPAIGGRLDFERLLDRLDGLMFTGSPSNVDPTHYGGPEPRPDNLEDKARDATTLPLIRAALSRSMPVMGVCRGIQEINVALGGTLFQHVHEQPGRIDHRSDKTKDFDGRYAITHNVKLTEGGKLQAALGGKSEIGVNSLHGQAIDRLADELVVEAMADDGTIEAVSHKTARSFFLAVQWHPEYRVTQNPDYLNFFRAFGTACRHYRSGVS